MKEAFLHYVWKYKYYNFKDLKTVSGSIVEVLHPGELNTNAGPDFTAASLKIDNQQWFGSVEIHIKANDWSKHKHHLDPGYNNVILHVVLVANAEVYTADGTCLPTLSLENRIPEKLASKADDFFKGKIAIPCHGDWSAVKKIEILSWRERLLVERIESKSGKIAECLNDNNGDWSQTAYEVLAQSFGLKLNQVPFKKLAQSIPFILVQKYRDDLIKLEALLFGAAGFLDQDPQCDYSKVLQTEFSFLKKLHGLNGLEKSNWTFMRMRPHAFPTLRIAFFAALWHRIEYLFEKLLSVHSLSELSNLLEIKLSNFWKNHFRFEVESSNTKEKKLGKSFIATVAINAIVPLAYKYGKTMGRPAHIHAALQLLQSLPAENNSILRQWKALDVPCSNAAESQGLIQLHNEYCKKQKCFQCVIGNQIFKTFVS